MSILELPSASMGTNQTLGITSMGLKGTLRAATKFINPSDQFSDYKTKLHIQKPAAKRQGVG
jgi:hypothetical protein